MSMASGALVGLVGGTGLVIAVSRLPFLRRPTLEDRVGPYVRDVTGLAWPQADASMHPLPNLVKIFGPAIDDAATRLGRILGGASSVRRRLDAAGDARSVQAFRVHQVLAAAVGFGVALVLSLLLLAGGGAGRPVVILVGCGFGVLAGVLGQDYALSRAVSRREQVLLAELPVVAELLALAVAAGEGPVAALERVARTARGQLGGELRRALVEARAGGGLVPALDAIARRTNVPALARFTDAFAVALDRGTPLADVLRAQAEDAREAGRRSLVEAGGRKEIAMLVPVVFGILPVTVLFALFPAFYGLTVVAP